MAMCANHPDTVAVAYCRECGKPLCGICRNEVLGAIFCADHVPAAKGYPSASTPANDPATAWDWTTHAGAAPAPGATYAGSPYAGSPYAAAYQAPPAPDLSGAAPPPPAYAASPYAAPPQKGHGPFPAWALILGTIPGVGAIYNGQYAKGLIHAVIFGLLITIVSHDNGPLTPLVGILIAAWWFYMVIEAFHTAHKRYHGFPVDEFSSLLNLRNKSSFPIGALVLICLGGLLLLDTSGLIPIDRLLRYWPLGLILAGVYMLYARSDRNHSSPPVQSLPQEFIDERR